MGNTVGLVDPLGFRTTIGYNARNEQVTVEVADNGVTTLAYDAVGNRVASTDPNGNTTTQVCDAVNRVVNTVDAEGFTTTFAYDAVGRLTQQIDASGNTTSFAYDARRLLTQETDALGQSFTFAYDAVGQRTSMTDRLGRRRDYDYDAVGRLEAENWFTTGGSFLQTMTMAYDAVGNLLTVADPNGTMTFAYDALDRKTSEQGLFGQVLTNVYDAVGNRTVREDNHAGLETFTYDAVNRLTSQQSTRGGSEPVRIDYDYTARNQLETIRRYADLSAAILIGGTDILYDAVGRETHRVVQDGSSATLSEVTLTYDLGGRLTEQVIDGTSTTFSYDDTDQITLAGTVVYDYDATGNRDSAGYTTTASNRMDASPTATFAYDTEGNRIGKTDTVSGDYWTYLYDTRNQLIQAEQRDSGNNLLYKVEYRYDAFGRRIEQVLNSTLTTRFSYDGQDVLADLDGVNSLVKRYIRTGEVDNLGAGVSAAGVVAFYLTDRQGTVLATVDSTGTLQNVLVYDVFGNLVSESNPDGDRYRYRYTGREWNAGTGLQFNRWRYYDPVTGKWTSEDPIRWSAGDVNLSRYVGNGPTNGTDPMGEALLIEPNAREAWQKYFDDEGIQVTFTPIHRDRYFFDYYNHSTALYVHVASSDVAKVKKMQESYAGQGYYDALYSALANPVGKPAILGSSGLGIIEILTTNYERNQFYKIGQQLRKQEEAQTLGQSPTDQRQPRSAYYQDLKKDPKPTTLTRGGSAKQIGSYEHEISSKQYLLQKQQDSEGKKSYTTPSNSVYELGRTSRSDAAEKEGDELLSIMANLLLLRGMGGLMSSWKIFTAKKLGVGYGAGVVFGTARQGAEFLNAKDRRQSFDIARILLGDGPTGAVLLPLLGPVYGGLNKLSPALGPAVFGIVPAPTIVGKGLQEIQNGHQGTGFFDATLGVLGRVASQAEIMGGFQWLKTRLGSNHADGPYCFTAGTPLLTPTGSQTVETLRPGDMVLSRSEFDPDGPIEARRVEKVFVRVGLVWTLRVGGREIRTTGEHPFYVLGKGWVNAAFLEVGDQLVSHDGQITTVDGIVDTRKVETVYNLRVADHHTYFVGCQEWGFSVWAHNMYGCLAEAEAAYRQAGIPITSSSPIPIPLRATRTPVSKPGYNGVDYVWEEGGFRYTARLHEATAGAAGQPVSWVVHRVRPGTPGSSTRVPGTNQKVSTPGTPRIDDVMVPDGVGGNTWISRGAWQNLIDRNAGRIGPPLSAQEQQMLRFGHYDVLFPD